MKLALVLTTPEVQPAPPVALLTGTFTARLAKAKALGYDGVEIMVMDPAQANAAEIRGLLAGAGLEVAAVASGALAFAARLTLLNQDSAVSERALRRLHDVIVFAAQVGAPLVTIGSFRGWCRSVVGDGQAQLSSILRTVCGWAGEYSVCLVIEPLNRYEADAVNTAQQALDLIADVGSPNLGLLLDTFHANIEEPSPTGAVRLAAQAGRLWHVHIGDSNRWPPGQGHFDFAGFVRALHQVNYTGYLSAELLGKPDPDAAARLTAAHMLPLVQG